MLEGPGIITDNVKMHRMEHIEQIRSLKCPDHKSTHLSPTVTGNAATIREEAINK